MSLFFTFMSGVVLGALVIAFFVGARKVSE